MEIWGGDTFNLDFLGKPHGYFTEPDSNNPRYYDPSTDTWMTKAQFDATYYSRPHGFIVRWDGHHAYYYYNGAWLTKAQFEAL